MGRISLNLSVGTIYARRYQMGHVARMEEGRVVHKILVGGKPDGKRPVDGRIILRWI
jgi:hypothetical protein